MAVLRHGRAVDKDSRPGSENMKKHLFAVVLCIAVTCHAQAARIKDIADVQGMRGNPLRGPGLVVGLNGTGDSGKISGQVLSSLIQRESGISLLPSELSSGSIALVMVTAQLGPYDRMGSPIDINVATLGDAKSLEGGMLLPTELYGLDGQVYAVANVSAISTASWTVEGKTGSKIAKNHPTVGHIPGGAYVEKEELSSVIETIGGNRFVTLNLHKQDFTTAERVRQAVEALYPGSAFAQDPGTIRIRIPQSIGLIDEISFISRIRQQDVEVDIAAIVVINERTGTIVIGGNVGILETAVAQGSLVVKIKEQQYVSQPVAPFSDSGNTQVVDSSSISVQEEPGHLIAVPKTVTVQDLADALNAIGATPRDLIAIFQALERAGALQGRIEMM